MRATATVHTSDGLNLSVYTEGDPSRPAILLVHGYPDNASVWDGVTAELRDEFHIVRYDVRGAGGSDAPPNRAGYRLDQLADDLTRVAREVSDKPVHLLAHDWGSIQAWHAVTEPANAELFASYTSISGPCLDHVSAWMQRSLRRGRLAPVAGQAVHSWYIGAFHLPGAKHAWRIGKLRDKFGAQVRDAMNGIELYRANIFPRAASVESRSTTVPVQQIVLTDDAFVRPAMVDSAQPWCTELWRRELHAEHWAPRSHPATVAEMSAELVRHIEGTATTRGLRRGRAKPAGGKRYDGYLVVVTGAGSGIGKATALAFAGQGADVVAVDIDEPAAKQAERELRERGVSAAAYTVDVADAEAVRALANDVRAQHGTPDIVFANAGIGLAGGLLQTPAEDWERVLGVNLLGAVYTLRSFAEQLVERGQGGHLVVTASMAAYAPWPVLTAYAASKAAVLSTAQSLRTELAPHGIGVSAICPGVVATNITATTRFAGRSTDEERQLREASTKAYRIRGFGPDKVADAVLGAVEHNRAVVPVTPEAKITAIAGRVSPGLVRTLGKWIKQ